MNKNILIGLGVLLAVVVVGFFLIGKPKTSQPAQTATSTSQTPTGPVKTFNVSAKEFAYTPSTITVNKGDTVSVNFTNAGTTTHNFTISEFNVASKNIGPGESDTVTFTADKSGTFNYFCSIDGHRSLGLTGTLEVK